MRERLLEGFQLQRASSSEVSLRNSAGYLYSVIVVDAQRDVYRICLTGPDRPFPINAFFKSHALPSTGASSALPNAANQKNAAASAILITLNTEATIVWKTAAPLLTVTEKSTGRVLHSDLPYRSYNLTLAGVRWYTELVRQDLHFGLGEVAAPTNLTGRRFEIRTSDSAHYNAWRTDPLYKHTPFLVRAPYDAPGATCTAYFSNSFADSVWDIGKSVDEPWGAYKTFEVETGALDNFLFFGDMARVSNTLQTITGVRPQIPPRWALGHIASPMGLAALDEPPAQVQLEHFLHQLKANDIPTTALHFSSSYTVTKGSNNELARNVFTLSTSRFPDLAGSNRLAHKLGIRIVPNIKPYINAFHPQFADLEANGGFFIDSETQKRAKTWIWSLGIGEKLEGAWLDTSSRTGFEFWANGVKELIRLGMDGMWNDNDEYSLHDDSYTCSWTLSGLQGTSPHQPSEGPQPVGLVGRTTFTTLLGRASYEALQSQDASRRPYILTRSASLATMGYCCSTWSGDNGSSWATLKGNVLMALNASMSGYHSYGSDVGGFAGPFYENHAEAEELWIRWVQHAAYSMRFCINSIHRNFDDPHQFDVNSPWRYPGVTEVVRRCIKRRYELLPYLYNLQYEGAEDGSPPVAAPFWGPFQTDARAWSTDSRESGAYWLGVGRLYVATVCEYNVKELQVYLPTSGDHDTYYLLSAPYSTHSGGETVTVSLTSEVIPVFARVGTVIPVGKPCATISATSTKCTQTRDGTVMEVQAGWLEQDDWRGVEIFPPPHDSDHSNGRWYGGSWIEDDGESALPAPTSTVKVEYRVVADGKSEDSIEVRASFTKHDFVPLWGETLWIILPQGDKRKISNASQSRTAKTVDGGSRTEWKINIGV